MCKLTAGAQSQAAATRWAGPKVALASAAGLCLLAVSLSSVADIYRWVDKRGIVNYTQQKPNNVPSTLVGKATPAAPRFRSNASDEDTGPAVSAPSDRQSQLSEAQQHRLAEMKVREQEEAARLAAQQEASCNRAQTVLEQLTTNNRIKIRGDDGTVRAIGDDERQARIEETQLSIAEHCVS